MLTTICDEEVMIGDRLLKFSATVAWHIDDRYGEDVDGNRGEGRRFIDAVDIEWVRDDKGKEVKITDEIRDEINTIVYETDLEE